MLKLKHLTKKTFFCLQNYVKPLALAGGGRREAAGGVKKAKECVNVSERLEGASVAARPIIASKQQTLFSFIGQLVVLGIISLDILMPDDTGLSSSIKYSDFGATAGLIAAGAAIAGSTGQAIATGKLNKKNREWQEKMTKEADERSLRNWNMQNEYNKPSAVMARYTEAGLNPLAVLGTHNESGIVGSVSSNTPQTSVPDLRSIGEQGAKGIAAYQDFRIKEMTLSNMAKQGELVEQEIRKAKEDWKWKAINNEKGEMNLNEESFKYGLRVPSYQNTADGSLPAYQKSFQDQLEYSGLRNKQIEQNVQATQQRLANEGKKIELDIMRTAADVGYKRAATTNVIAERGRIMAAIESLTKGNALKDLEYKVRERGANPNDPYWQKKLTEAVEGFFDDLPHNRYKFDR